MSMTSKNSLVQIDLGMKTCPGVIEIRNITSGITQGDYGKSVANSALLAMYLS